MISRVHSIRRRSAFQLSSNCSRRRASSSSFSAGLGSRLLKATEKDPPVNNQSLKNPATDPPKRVSIFSRPASSTPPASGFMAKIGDLTGAAAPAKPRFSISAALQTQNIRRSAGDMWKPIPGTATKPAPTVEAVSGLDGASSIRDFARRAAERAKSDAQDTGPSIKIIGGKGLFTKEELSDMRENFDPSNKPLSSAAAIMADVLNQPEEEVESDDEAPPPLEITAGEMRYWKFQVISFGGQPHASRLLLIVKLRSWEIAAEYILKRSEWRTCHCIAVSFLSGLENIRHCYFIFYGLLPNSSPVLGSIMDPFTCMSTK